MNSILRRTTLLLCAGLGTLLIIVGLVIYFSIRSALVAQFDATLAAKAQALIVAVDLDDEKIDIDFTVRDFAGFGAAAQGDFFEIFDHAGRSLARSPSLAAQSLPLPTSTKSPVYRDIRLPDGRVGREVAVAFTPLDDDVATLGELRLIVASYSGGLSTSLRTIALILIAVVVVGLIATVLLIRFSLSRGLLPLDQLAAQVREIDVSQLHKRLPVEEVPDELQLVAAKVNEMLVRLEEGFERERRFSSYAAHELRTPLAELKVMVELVERWPDEFNRDHAGEMLRVIGETEALLMALSLLARTEAGSPQVAETFALKPAVDGLVDSLQALAQKRQLTFRLDVQESDVTTAPVLWRAILQNLLSNAASYAQTGTIILVEASASHIAVSNAVDDLTEADLPHLTERFWRKSESRSDRTHSGLGLSIVAACARQLHGECRMSLNESRFRCEVRWPQADHLL